MIEKAAYLMATILLGAILLLVLVCIVRLFMMFVSDIVDDVRDWIQRRRR